MTQEDRRKIMASVMTISLAFSVSVLAPEETKSAPPPAGEFEGKTVILHSNDVHGEVMGYSYIAALRTAFKDKGADVILADAGDFSQGGFVYLSKGADAVAMMNAAEYDVATLGNHEFNYGDEHLMDNLKDATFHAICADAFKDGEPLLDPSWTYEKGNLKIGFFGIDTPETRAKVNPGLIRDMRFPVKDELYACAQEQVDALREDGADIVVALTHLGVDDESAPDGHRSVDLYAHTQGVDIILDGHSHTVMEEGENGEPIQSTGTGFENIGVVVIDNKKEEIEKHYLIPTKVTEKAEENGEEVEKVVSELDKDAAVAAKAQEIIDRVNAAYGETVAVSEVFLDGERNPGVRTHETNLADLVTDAIVWKMLKEDGALTVDDDHVVGIINAGEIRASIEPGNVTRGDLKTALPFEDIVSVAYATGAEILEALEASCFAIPDAASCYPQTFGIDFTLEAFKPLDKGELYPDSTYYKPATIQRVTITAINEKPFDPAARYAVVTTNFLTAGGDSYYVFGNAAEKFETGILLNEALTEYITDALGGVISKETYGTPRGDQTIILAPAYAVSVTGGSGSGDYKEGDTVSVSADAAPDGQAFDKWTGADGLTFTSGDANSASAAFVMPAADVTLSATFRDAPGYTVIVMVHTALRIRGGPGSNYGKVGLLHNGDRVQIVEELGNWGKLESGDWIYLKYTQKA